MVVYIQTAAGAGNAGPRSLDWHPWYCEPDADPKATRLEIEQLAAHRHIRDRGGISSDEEPYLFTVWSYTDKCPKHPNGRPMVVNAVTFTGRKDKCAS